MRRTATALALVLATAGLQAAAAPDWRPVPDAPELQVDVGSVQPRGRLVSAWVRHAARARVAAALAAQQQPLPGQHSTAVLGEFDCQARTVRTLGLLAYDVRGRLLASSGVPTRVQPVPAVDGLLQVYDAVCELARAGRDADAR